MQKTLVLLAGLFLSAGRNARGQTIEVVPNRAMVDQTVSIRAGGLVPNERVTIRAELEDGADEHWSSRADFVAGPEGNIDTSAQPAITGSYKGVSAMGLVWSMAPDLRKVSHYLPPKQLAAQIIEFRLLRGSTEIAATQLEQVWMADGVERLPVHEGVLRGLLFSPREKDRHPGVLVLGGSEGGLPSRRAAWLASHGFAALALAYFRFEDLPENLAGIPLEYFGRALSWMARQPQIDAERVGVMGVSRGAELALQLGSMFPRIRAGVAYSPANVRYPACCGFTTVPYAWTWNGNPLPFRPLQVGLNQQAMAMRAEIEVERTEGSLLLISGESDRVWDSSSMADSIVARLRKHHFTYDVENLKYPHAGHRAGRPEIVPAWQEPGRNPLSGREVEMGGTPQSNAESSLDAIGKVIDFFERNLVRR